MNESVIALVFDFDGTLGQDTITTLVSSYENDPKQFWQRVDHMIEEGWDPPLAYMHVLWQYERESKLDLSQKALRAIGKKLLLFPGLPKAFIELREFVHSVAELHEARIALEFYIISGGIEEMILGSGIARYMNGIFGCNFSYDKKTVTGIKSAISFTEKTRYLYGINKGISSREQRANPYKINDALPRDTRRVPFSQM